MVIFHCYVIVHQRVYSGHHHFSTTICCVPKHLLVGQSCEVMTYEVFSRQKKVLHCLQAWDLVDSRLRMSCGQWKMSQKFSKYDSEELIQCGPRTNHLTLLK